MVLLWLLAITEMVNVILKNGRILLRLLRAYTTQLVCVMTGLLCLLALVISEMV